MRPRDLLKLPSPEEREAAFRDKHQGEQIFEITTDKATRQAGMEIVNRRMMTIETELGTNLGTTEGLERVTQALQREIPHVFIHCSGDQGKLFTTSQKFLNQIAKRTQELRNTPEAFLSSQKK